MAKVLQFHFLFIILWDVVETDCKYYNQYRYLSKTTDCSYSFSTGGTALSGFGLGIGGFFVILLFLICCCFCKGNRQMARDEDVQTTGRDMTVLSSNTAFGGYVNTAAYPPGILSPCPPEYSYPATQEGFLGNCSRSIYLPQEAVLSTEHDEPPPPYTENEPPISNAYVPPIIRHNEDPTQNTSKNRPRHQYVMRMQHVPPIMRHMEGPAHNTSQNRPRHQYVMKMQ